MPDALQTILDSGVVAVVRSDVSAGLLEGARALAAGVVRTLRVQKLEGGLLVCGMIGWNRGTAILASTLESKSISALFEGAAAGAMVVGEILCALPDGHRFELRHIYLRSLQNPCMALHVDWNRAEMARTGIIGVAKRVPKISRNLTSSRSRENLQHLPLSEAMSRRPSGSAPDEPRARHDRLWYP